MTSTKPSTSNDARLIKKVARFLDADALDDVETFEDQMEIAKRIIAAVRRSDRRRSNRYLFTNRKHARVTK